MPDVKSSWWNVGTEWKKERETFVCEGVADDESTGRNNGGESGKVDDSSF